MGIETLIDRRRFLETVALSAAGTGSLLAGLPVPGEEPASAPPGLAAANGKIGLGFIGVGGRGTNLLEIFSRFPDVQVVGVCDVRKSARENAKRIAGGKAEVYGDYRKLLDRRDVDAVVIATNGHWHPLPAIHACQAGKDVYVEKPLSLTPQEGRAVVDAARAHRRVAALGTQQRSSLHYAEAVQYIRSGKLGRVALVETLNAEHSPPERFGNPPDCEPPADLDWDTWLGPARKVPYHPARAAGHYFFWDYGGGWQSDWAVHHHDIVHWAMGADAPLAVAASGGKYFLSDCTEMPDTLEACFEYPGFLSVYRLTWSNARPREGLSYGNIFYGSQGTLVLNRSGWRVFADNETRPSLERPGAAGDVAHQRNFLDCVRTRSQPNADIETGHRSSSPSSGRRGASDPPKVGGQRSAVNRLTS